MKKHLPVILFIILSFTLGCSKKSDNSPKSDNSSKKEEPPKTKFDITQIALSTQNPILGQRLTFKPILTDSTGNINYLWQIYYGDSQTAEAISGQQNKSIAYTANKSGAYTVKLTITRGATEKSSLGYKFNVAASTFQYGVWGDSEKTIRDAESDNGSQVSTDTLTLPSDMGSVQNLTALSYLKAGRYDVYYFQKGLLFAGSSLRRVDVSNPNTDLTGIYNTFLEEKDKLSKQLNTPVAATKEWHFTPDSFTPNDIKNWDTDDQKRLQAIRMGFLVLKVRVPSANGNIRLSLYRSGKYVMFESSVSIYNLL